MAPQKSLCILLLCSGLVAGCRAPDRWQVSTSADRGLFDHPNLGDLDTENYGLEVGVSGPIWDRPERRDPDLERGHADMLEEIRALKAAKPIEAPGGEIPWDLIVTALLAVGGLKGGEVGLRKYRRSRSNQRR